MESLLIEENLFYSDSPINDESNDSFHRMGFSERIASAIVKNKSNNSLVIGIYGSWGEGKTTILNFIDSNLSNHFPNIVTIRFNPWRFNDEEQLLRNFFQSIIYAINKTIDQQIDIKNKSEKFGELLKKYGKFLRVELPFVGNIGESIENVGDFLSDATIEDFKQRISDILSNIKCKIVVFFDDIDRLDKEEIFAIFRLVKLNADFQNTVYILSFDEQMVSRAIAERFGGDEQLSGSNFLEKIIQVPLNIPKASKYDLRVFFDMSMNHILNTNQIKLEQGEFNRFAKHFNSVFLPRITTPRLIIRYCNMLSFSIPLLYKEVNISDLMLIEGIKIFLPKLYTIIRDSTIFDGYYGRMDNSDDESKHLLYKKLEANKQFYDEYDKKSIHALVDDLFPSELEKYDFDGNLDIDKARAEGRYDLKNGRYDNYNQWHKDKRICAPMYFDRYFTYYIGNRQIGEKQFNDFLKHIENNNIELAESQIVVWIMCEMGDIIFFRLRMYLKSEIKYHIFYKTLTEIIINVFATDKYSFRVNLLFNSAKWHAIRIIREYWVLMLKHMKRNEDLSFTIEMLNSYLSLHPELSFTFELLYYCSSYINKITFFELEHYEIIYNNCIKDKAMKYDDNNLFEKYGNYNPVIIETWSAVDLDGLKSYISNILKTITIKEYYYEQFIVKFFKNNNEFHRNEIDFLWYSNLFNVEEIYNYVLTNKIFKESEIKPNSKHREKAICSVENFIYWYEVDRKTRIE